jgi:endo-1,4-beta-xylanase
MFYSQMMSTKICKSKIFKNFTLLIVLFSQSMFLFAQTPDKHKIEKELLAKARLNIEKYRKGDASLVLKDAQGKAIKGAKVKINQLTQDFLFGNLSEDMFKLSTADAAKFQEKFTGLFNYTELTVKWWNYEQLQGKPEWQKLQQKLDWCKQNAITPKGHTLGWTHVAGTPEWLMKLPVEMVYDLYKARIQNLVGGFKDQITMWDVVNEPINTITWEMALKDTIADAKIDEGSRYNTEGITLDQFAPWVEKSYQWAHQANPKGDFHINEFYILSKPETREKYFQFIKLLQKRNIPINGIGIQAHEPREMWFSPIEMVASYDKFQELGLPLHITEFTPQSSGKTITGGWREGVWTEETQAEFSEQFYILAFGHPAMASIHWWGLSDGNIWLKDGGLLDKDFNPKPVYTRLHKLIKQDWMTKNLELNANAKGKVDFRGFFGNYQITITKPDGSVQVIEKHLKEKGNNNWEIIVP